jgi:hypothetical protein
MNIAKLASHFALVAGLFLACTTASLASDERKAISLPPDMKDRFLAEMRGHMGNLDDIISAIAEGEFSEAADIAEIQMDFGHSMWNAMQESGMSSEQVMQMKKQMQAKGMGQGMGQGMGKGMGRHMPDDFRAMGASFHEAAQAFAARARQSENPPSSDEYKGVMEALQGVTAACRGCHEAFRVE